MDLTTIKLLFAGIFVISASFVVVITLFVLPNSRNAYIRELNDYCEKVKSQFRQILSGTDIHFIGNNSSRVSSAPNSARSTLRSYAQLHAIRRPFINSHSQLTHLLGIYGDVPYNRRGFESFDMEGIEPIAFKNMVKKRADKQKTIFLSIVDSGYADMARNLYETSYVAFNITNYLFVGLDSKACDAVRHETLKSNSSSTEPACVTYFSDVNGNQSSDWGSEGFRRKTHYKTKVVMDALHFGMNVVIVDLDIVFFQNPLPYFNCSKCDIEIQSDVIEGNSGFYIARPTQNSIALHEKSLVLGLGKRGRKLTNQKAMSKIIGWMKKSHKLKVKTLDEAQFPCGSRYFEEGHLMFRSDGDCADCVIVHNNWIVSKAAKIYRFKEAGLWRVDTGGYYSNPSRKYLTYENGLNFGPNDTVTQETNALRAALFIGHLLNRTVILPTFTCHGCTYGACNNSRGRCALNTNYRLTTFDAQFNNEYREHEFLLHPLVPKAILHSQSSIMLIESTITRKYHIKDHVTNISGNLFSPLDKFLFQPTPAEVIRWFVTTSSYSILRFHSLYGVFSDFLSSTSNSSSDSYSDVRIKINSAFDAANYRQYKSEIMPKSLHGSKTRLPVKPSLVSTIRSPKT